MYEVKLTRIARKAYLKLPEKFRKKVFAKLQELAKSPMAKHHDVKRLRSVENAYRLRIQDWRVIYRLEHNKMIIEIIKIAHRKEVYK